MNLKPCPFCGGVPETCSAMGETWILCLSCRSSCSAETDPSKIVWNNRPIEDALIEALEHVMDQFETTGWLLSDRTKERVEKALKIAGMEAK